MLKIRVEPAQPMSGPKRQKRIFGQILTIGKNFESSKLNPNFELKTELSRLNWSFWKKI